MRLHSTLAPKFDHYASLSGGSLSSTSADVYNGIRGRLKSLSSNKKVKGAAVAAATIAAAIGGKALLDSHTRGRQQQAWQALEDDPIANTWVLETFKGPLKHIHGKTKFVPARAIGHAIEKIAPPVPRNKFWADEDEIEWWAKQMGKKL